MMPPAPRDEASVPEPASAALVLLNLVLLILLGVAASGWVLFYTDWFPVVGGLLGLGGLFAWIAFVSGLLTDERKEQFQNGFERRVLMERRTWMAIALAAALFFLWASAHGSVVLQSLADDRDHTVKIGRAGKGREPDVGFLPPRSLQKHLVFTGWSGRAYRVKISGLPAQTFEVAPLRRRIVAAPSSFQARPVLLIVPSARVASNAEATPFTLVVWRGGKKIAEIDSEHYRGEVVWVGCDTDVLVPEKVIDRWRLEMLRKNLPEEVLTRRTAPLAVAEDVTLTVGEWIRAELLRKDGGAYAKGKAKVRVPSPGDFVQELAIDIPSSPLAESPAMDAGEVEPHAEDPPS